MEFTTYGGTVTHQDIEREKEDQRQALIKKYEAEGYFRPWAIAKADYEIKCKHEEEVERLTPLVMMGPLD